MNVTEFGPRETTSFFQLFSINESNACSVTNFYHLKPIHHAYRITSLLLGPANALLNGFCVLVFHHCAWRKSTMSRILKGLSIVEICMGVSLFLHGLFFTQNTMSPCNMLSAQSEQVQHDHVSRETRLACTLASFLLMTMFSRCLLAFQIARNWCVVLLAAYRYDVICRPMGARTAFPRERIKLYALIIIALSFLVAAPRVFENGIIICRKDGRMFEELQLLVSSSMYQILFLGVVMFIVQSGGPVICVCVLSAFVIRIIAKRRKMRRLKERQTAKHLMSIKRQHPGEGDFANCKESCPVGTRNVTKNGTSFTREQVERPVPSGDKLMFAVCITFFVLETPAFFSKILQTYLSNNHPNADAYFSVIANILIYLDSTLNAFVYMASNPTFRKVALLQLARYRNRICCMKQRQDLMETFEQTRTRLDSIV